MKKAKRRRQVFSGQGQYNGKKYVASRGVQWLSGQLFMGENFQD